MGVARCTGGGSFGLSQWEPMRGGGAAVTAHATRRRPAGGFPPPQRAEAALAAAGPNWKGRPLVRESGVGGNRPPARSVACRIACRAHETAATHPWGAGEHRLSSAKRVCLGRSGVSVSPRALAFRQVWVALWRGSCRLLVREGGRWEGCDSASEGWPARGPPADWCGAAGERGPGGRPRPLAAET